MSRTAIIGEGGLGRELAQFLAVKDRVFLSSDRIDELRQDDKVYVAIGDPLARRRVCEMLYGRFRVHSFRHPSFVGNWANIAGEEIIFPHTLVSSNVSVGFGLLMGVCASIGHDSTLGSFCTIGPYVGLCGNVHVGNNVSFGIGAKVLPGLRIEEGASIGAGAVVTRNVRACEKVFGNPARRIA